MAVGILSLTHSVDKLDKGKLSGLASDIQGLCDRLTKDSQGNRNYPRAPLCPTPAKRVLTFILTNRQMWHDVGNVDPTSQAPEFIHPEYSNPLFLDGEHTKINPRLTEKDYLLVFKEYMRRLAARKNEGSDEANWYKMQDELAEQIARWPTLLDKVAVA